MINFDSYSKNYFTKILLSGFFLLSISFYFLFYILSKAWRIKDFIFTELEAVCGCTSHLSFSNHPYLFTFIISLSVVLIFIAIFLIKKVFVLYKKTRRYTRLHLASKRYKLSGKLKSALSDTEIKEKLVKEGNICDVSVFCYGIIKPRIFISSKLVKKLSIEELKAVLLHEYHHLRKKDSLRILIVKTITGFFYFVPFISLWSKKFFVFTEHASDENATRFLENKKSLISAVMKVLELKEKHLMKTDLALPYFGEVTEERIKRFADDKYIIDLSIFKENKFKNLFVLILTIFIGSVFYINTQILDFQSYDLCGGHFKEGITSCTNSCSHVADLVDSSVCSE